MDTGRITNLKIPHPSFNMSASVAQSNASLGSGSLATDATQAQVYISRGEVLNRCHIRVFVNSSV